MIVIYSHTALVTSAVILESYFSSHFGKMIDTIWLMTFLGYSLNWGIQSLRGGNICLVLLVQLVQMIVTMSQNNNNNKCWKLFPWMICCCFFGMWVNWAFASVVLPVFCSDYSITWARTLRCLCMQLFFYAFVHFLPVGSGITYWRTLLIYRRIHRCIKKDPENTLLNFPNKRPDRGYRRQAFQMGACHLTFNHRTSETICISPDWRNVGSSSYSVWHWNLYW